MKKILFLFSLFLMSCAEDVSYIGEYEGQCTVTVYWSPISFDSGYSDMHIEIYEDSQGYYTLFSLPCEGIFDERVDINNRGKGNLQVSNPNDPAEPFADFNIDISNNQLEIVGEFSSCFPFPNFWPVYIPSSLNLGAGGTEHQQIEIDGVLVKQ